MTDVHLSDQSLPPNTGSAHSSEVKTTQSASPKQLKKGGASETVEKSQETGRSTINQANQPSTQVEAVAPKTGRYRRKTLHLDEPPPFATKESSHKIPGSFNFVNSAVFNFPLEKRIPTDEEVDHQLEITLENLHSKYDIPLELLDAHKAALREKIRDVQADSTCRAVSIGEESHFILYPSSKGLDGSVKPIKVTEVGREESLKFRLLGSGTFSNVIEAGGRKAVKTPRQRLNPDQAKELLNEAAIGRYLRKLNGGEQPVGIQKSARLISFEDHVGLLVHRYDGDLNKLAKQPIPKKQLMEGFRDLSKGVAFLHTHDIPHRDIKPGNILYDSKGLYLGDFGGVQANFAQKSDWSAGTYAFMSLADFLALGIAQKHGDPAAGIKIGEQSDVFALGMSLYAAILGKEATPYARSPIGHCITDKGFTKNGIGGFKVIGEKYGEEVAELIKGMVAANRDDRPTAAECAQAFTHLAAVAVDSSATG